MKISLFTVLLIAFLIGLLIGLVIFPVVYILVTGDFPGANQFYGLQEDSPLVTWLLSIR